MALLDFFNRKKEQRGYVDDEQSATSLIFRGYRLDESATSLSAFFSAMELISNSIAQLPIEVRRNEEIDKTHPLNFVFKNMLISKFTFMKMIVTDMILHGNAFAYIERAKDGTPIRLIYCEFGSVNINYNHSAQTLYYNINFVRKGRIEPCDVLHFIKNSNNGVNGRSLISYANLVLNLAKATDKAASKYYSSGCALQGALTIKGTRKNSKEQARQAFEMTHGEAGSGLVILDDDMTYTPISSNSKDSQMLEARTFNVKEVARYFNINPILLGDNTGAGYSSIEQANVEYVTHTLQPYVSLIEEELNRKLIKPSEYGIVTINLDENYLLKGDKSATATYLNTLVNSGIISRNEARKMLGMKAIEGGDEYIIPYTNIEQNTITDNKTKNEDGNEGN